MTDYWIKILNFVIHLLMALPPQGIMPMSIRTLGNSSVATVPTLFDLIVKDRIEGHKVSTGDIILFASVGAGMNINAFAYKM